MTINGPWRKRGRLFYRAKYAMQDAAADPNYYKARTNRHALNELLAMGDARFSALVIAVDEALVDSMCGMSDAGIRAPGSWTTIRQEVTDG